MKLTLKNGRPVLVYGDNEAEDDWIKQVDPDAMREDRKIIKELKKEAQDEQGAGDESNPV